jgi:hypothetical protein
VWKAVTGVKPGGGVAYTEGRARTQAEAVAKKRAAEAAGRRPHADRETVGEHLDHWLNDIAKPNTRGNTWDRYEQVVRPHLKPRVGGVPLRLFTVSRVTRLWADMGREGITPGNIKKCSEVLAAALEAAVAEEKIPVAPTRKAAKPKVIRGEVETRGLVAELDLPMRVRGGEPFYQDAKAFTGVLAGLHPSELDARRTAFLTKDGALRPCTPAEAAAVGRNGGVLYHPEVANTTLILVFKDTLDGLKGLAREAKGYAVELAFSDLHAARPLAWGHFRRDAYLAADWDCQRLWADHLLDPDGPQPVYFTTAFADTSPGAIPEVVRARLDALRVRDRDGRVVGGYRVR